MTKLIISFVISFLTLLSYSQNSESNKFNFKNSVQLDAGGHGFVYSVNYERIILNGNRFKTAAQAGMAYYPPKTGLRDVWVPLGINEIFSFSKHHIEIGIGHVIFYESTRDLDNNATSWDWDRMFTGRIGYRFQSPDGHLILRAGFTPFLEYRETNEFHPSGGISVGYSF